MSDITSATGSWITPKSLLSIFAVIVLSFYLMGDSYHFGYLHHFGLSREQFPLTVLETFGNTFFAFSTAVGFIWQYLKDNPYQVPLILLVVCVFVIYLAIARLHTEHTDKTQSTRLPSRTGWCAHLQRGAVIVWILAGLWLFIIAPLFAYLFGQVKAETRVQQYSGCGFQGHPRCIYIYHGSQLVNSGLLISQSGARVSLWDGEKVIIDNIDGKKVYVVSSGSMID